MHDYPKGAITNEKDLFFHLLGQPLYHVHGLGESSYLTEMVVVRNLHTNEYGSRIIEYCDAKNKYNATVHLADCNIGAHHNRHYLFRCRKDAEDYLQFAKKHTPNLRLRSYWD